MERSEKKTARFQSHRRRLYLINPESDGCTYMDPLAAPTSPRPSFQLVVTVDCVPSRWLHLALLLDLVCSRHVTLRLVLPLGDRLFGGRSFSRSR